MGDRFCKMKTLLLTIVLVLALADFSAACCCCSGGGEGCGQCPPEGGCTSNTCSGTCHADLEDASECPSSELLQQSAFGDTFQEDVLVAESIKVKHHAPDAPDCGASKCNDDSGEWCWDPNGGGCAATDEECQEPTIWNTSQELASDSTMQVMPQYH